MVEKFCENYGREVGKFNGNIYFSFFIIFELSEDGVESELRNLGFGYRYRQMFVDYVQNYMIEFYYICDLVIQ